MQIIDFITISELSLKNESEKAKLLCFFDFKENSNTIFPMSKILELFLDAGFSTPNTSRMKKKLTKEKIFRIIKGSNSLEFIPVIIQQLQNDIGKNWSDFVSISSDSELFDEVKFCGKRTYLDKLIYQINSSYKNNCYDACAVLMRRVFEILLILSYQKLNIDNEIKRQDGTYLLLDNIVNNAINNKTLNLSRIKNEFDNFRKIGNFSSHRIEYYASKKDIDDIRIDFRVALEELYHKAGLL